MAGIWQTMWIWKNRHKNRDRRLRSMELEKKQKMYIMKHLIGHKDMMKNMQNY